MLALCSMTPVQQPCSPVHTARRRYRIDVVVRCGEVAAPSQPAPDVIDCAPQDRLSVVGTPR